jgi:hypothetical protein
MTTSVDAFTQNRRLGRGVNIIGYDPLWDSREQARMQDKHFRLISEAGFDHVRINMHPFKQAERLGWSWGYWQFDSDFIVYDIDADRWVAPILNALIPETTT